MTWFRIDDNFALHPKVLAAGNAAIGLWARAGAWSAQMLTDGRVPADIIPVLGGRQEDADALVRVGLWTETLHGYEFHDWQGRQPTKAEVEARREAAAERMRTLRQGRKAHSEDSDVRTNFARSSHEVRDPGPSRTSKEVGARKRAPSTRGTRLPADFTLSQELIDYTREKAPAVDLARELEGFRDYWASVPGQKGVKLDWSATWRTWVRRAQERAEQNGWKSTRSAQPMPSSNGAREKWLAARGVSLEEYERRKNETGWLDSLKEK